MALHDRVTRAMNGVFGGDGALSSARVIVPTASQAETEAERFRALRAYRDNNRLYDELSRVLREAGVNREAIKGLRNPANAGIEFYPAVIMPGTLPDALPIEYPEGAANTDAITDAIHQVWEWSNWNSKKQRFIRDLATLGEQWIKVSTRTAEDGTATRVYFALIEPEHVTEFDTDERDFLTYIRLDIPRQRRTDGKTEQYIHTEVWDKDSGTYAVWEHNLPGRTLDQLGEPTRQEEIKTFGIDFLPFVQCKFVDDGDERGRALIEPALDKIDEANRMATRLHQLLFRYGEPDMQVVSVGTDPDGLPLPPAKFGADIPRVGPATYRPPSNTKLEPILPNVNFAAHLDAVNAELEHLEQTDLPELIWYQIADAPELSGKAIRLMLTAPIARAVEVRGNCEAALIRANQMALTIGIASGLFDQSLGDYHKGDFTHTFAERAIVPLSEEEEAAIAKAKAEAAVLHMTVGYPADRILEDLGMTQAEVKEHLASQPGSAATPEEAEQPGEFDRGFVGSNGRQAG